MAGILTCTSLLMIFLAQGGEKLIYLNFLMGTVTDSFAFSLVGTYLTDASLTLDDAAYSYEWYRCDVRNHKLILMILTRSQNATAVKIPFFKATLETFLGVKKFFQS